MSYIMLLFFYSTSIIGWLWEVVLYWINCHGHYSIIELLMTYRGVLHGPWAPIYGVGLTLLIIIYYLVHKHKGVFVLTSMASCALVEYITSYLLEVLFNAKWWDYTEEFMNINGRICLMSVAGLGIIGSVLIIGIQPLVSKALTYQHKPWIKYLAAALTLLFALDVIVTFMMPNTGLGVTVLGGM